MGLILIPFSASSRGGRGAQNNDGSRSVYCHRCQAFIGTSFQNFHRALCEPCRREANDEAPLTAEALQQYELSKQGRSDVSMLLVPSEPPKVEGVTHKKFTFRTMAGGVLTALGKFGLNLGAQLKEPEVVEGVRLSKSKEVAQSKRRKRLFADVDIDAKD